MTKHNTITTEDRATIEAATRFNVFLRISPTKKINQEAATLAEAAAIYAEMKKTPAAGRHPIVYAYKDAEGHQLIPVPVDMLEAATAAAATEADDMTDIPAFLRREPAITEVEPVAEVAAEPKAPAKAKAKKAKAKVEAPAKEITQVTGRRRNTEAMEAAQRGIIPSAPDFSANTHKPFRKKLDALKALVEAGDIAGLKAFKINPISSSPKAMAKYRDIAVVALEALAATKAAA